MILTLPIPRPPITANQARSKGWRNSAKAKIEVAQIVHTICMQQKVPALGPCAVTITWFAPDMRRRDVDSLGVFAKACLDALVKYGVWEDDNYKYVPSLTLAIQIDKGNPRIQLELQELA